MARTRTAPWDYAQNTGVAPYNSTCPKCGHGCYSHGTVTTCPKCKEDDEAWLAIYNENVAAIEDECFALDVADWRDWIETREINRP